MMWGSLSSNVGGQEARARVILVLRGCIWNTFAISIVLRIFYDNSSLGSTPRHLVYPPGSRVLP